MARYQGRHAPRHAKPATGAMATLRRPAVGTSLAVAVAAAGAAGVSAQNSAGAEPVAFVLAGDVVAEADAQNQTATDDESRISAARAGVNAQLALQQGKAAEQARLRAVAVAEARKAAAAKAAREAKRKALVANAQKDPKAAAKTLLPEYGWGEDQWQCLDKLWEGESNWRHTAENPTSGAYGIPQSLPANKMATVADDYRTNPVTQIKWGMGYIKDVYGTPCKAWGSWNARSPHWY